MIVYTAVAIQIIPYLVVAYYLRKADYFYPTVKAIWLPGFMQAFADCALSIIQTNPEFFTTYYGAFLTWLVILLNSLQHWLFGLEYYSSSELIMLRLSGREPNES